MRKNGKHQKGYTLLEYCAGAAIIAGILWTALNALGGSLNGLLTNVSAWANRRSTGISQN